MTLGASVTVSRETKPGRKAPNGNGAPAPAEQLTRSIVMIDLEQIEIGPNVRVNVEAIDELAESIKTHGVLQPIKVRAAGEKWIVVWGQRRVLAARKAGLERIPAITTAEEPTPEKLAAEQLVENLHRADLNPMDRARAMRTIVDSGVTQADLSRELGLAPSTIANELGLLAAPDKIQDALEAGKISPAHARAIKGLPAAEQVRLAKLAIDSGRSAHELENDAKWARQEVTRQERDRERLEKVAASAIAQLTKAVSKDALIVASGAVVTNAIKKAGWTNLHAGDRWQTDVLKKAGECGCATWLVEYETYGGKAEAKLKPACVDAEHRQARRAAAEAERDREITERQAKMDALEKTRAADAKAISIGLAGPLAGIPAPLCRALLYMVADDYQAITAMQARHGASSNQVIYDQLWPLIAGLSDSDARGELAIAIAGEATPVGYSAERSGGLRKVLLELVGA